MKTASAALDLFLDASSTGIMRHLITVTPRAGSVVYWTDHTSDLVYGGNTFKSGGDGTTCPIPIVGGCETVAGLNVTTMSIGLLCGGVATFNSVSLPAAAAAGTLDGAWVKVERVYGGAELDLTMGALHVFEGPIGQVGYSDHVVNVEVESGTALLRVQLPKTIFQPGCTAMVYDAQCALTRATFTDTWHVAAGTTLSVVLSDSTRATGTLNTQGWYALGVLTFTTGALSGVSRGVRSYSATSGAFTLDRPLPSSPSLGDHFTVYPGCPRTLAACGNNTAASGPQFNNIAHFRGFPFVPSNESGD